jgi:hypothetical protein
LYQPRAIGREAAALLGIALCKIGWFLNALNSGLRLRTDCDLRIATNGVRYWTDRIGEGGTGTEFNFDAITHNAAAELTTLVTASSLDPAHAPFPLKHVAKAKEDKKSDQGDEPAGDEEESDAPSNAESDE